MTRHPHKSPWCCLYLRHAELSNGKQACHTAPLVTAESQRELVCHFKSTLRPAFVDGAV